MPGMARNFTADYTDHPLINGLSDHDGQIITFSNIANSAPRHIYTITREINRHTIMDFTLLLSYENWEDVFQEKDVNILFNNFLNTSESPMPVFQTSKQKMLIILNRG